MSPEDTERVTTSARALVEKIGPCNFFVNVWKSTLGFDWLCAETHINGAMYSVSFKHDGTVTEQDFRDAVKRARAELRNSSKPPRLRVSA
jgi:hypothetical protein